MEEIEGKWILTTRTLRYVKGEYVISVFEAGKQWVWSIFKDGEQVDSVYQYPYAPSGELDARVKGEKALTKLIEKDEQKRREHSGQTPEGGPADQALETEPESTEVSN